MASTTARSHERATVCPRCAGTFACGVAADRATLCFCASYALGDARLAELRATQLDCPYETCLATLVAHPELPACPCR